MVQGLRERAPDGASGSACRPEPEVRGREPGPRTSTSSGRVSTRALSAATGRRSRQPRPAERGGPIAGRRVPAQDDGGGRRGRRWRTSRGMPMTGSGAGRWRRPAGARRPCGSVDADEPHVVARGPGVDPEGAGARDDARRRRVRRDGVDRRRVDDPGRRIGEARREGAVRATQAEADRAGRRRLDPPQQARVARGSQALPDAGQAAGVNGRSAGSAGGADGARMRPATEGAGVTTGSPPQAPARSAARSRAGSRRRAGVMG